MRYGPWLLAVLLMTLGCAGGQDAASPAAPATAASSDAETVVTGLREAGLQVRAAGTVVQPFFTVPAQVYSVDGGDLQLYEFATAREAEAAAGQVSPTGESVGTAMVTWMAPPHFFRKNRVIANYVGSSPKTLAELQRLLGPQFAGR